MKTNELLKISLRQNALYIPSEFITGKATTITGPTSVLVANVAKLGFAFSEEALQAIGSALRGEAEPIRKYGILLNDAT